MNKFEKLLTIMGSVLVLSMFCVFNVSAESNDCFAIAGATTGSSGIDGGVYNFSATNPPNLNNKACIKKQADFDEERLFFDGYVWNDNLGWVSTKSIREDQTGSTRFTDTFVLNKRDQNGNLIGDHTPYSNQGISNGNYIYYSYLYAPGGAGVEITGLGRSETAVDNGDGASPVGAQLFGYWWGQNLGYLRLNCREYHDSERASARTDNPVTANNEDPANYCETSNHRVFVQSVSDGIAYLAGHAWSDAHGWVDFDGVQIPVDGLHQVIYPRVTLKSVVYKDPSWKNFDGTPVANGSTTGDLFLGESGYALAVEFYDSPAFSGNRLNVPSADFCFIWNDDRYLNYLNPEDNPEEINDCYDAPTKPYGLLDKQLNQDDFSYDSASKIFKMKPDSVLKSQVPALAAELYLEAIVANGVRYDLGAEYDLEFAPPYDYKLFQGELDGSCADYKPSQVEQSLQLNLGFNEPITLCGDFVRGGLASENNLVVDTNYDYSIAESSGLDLTDLYFNTEETPYVICSTIDNIANNVDLDEAIDPGARGPQTPTSFVDSAVIWLGVFTGCTESSEAATLEAVNIDSVLVESRFAATVRYLTAQGEEILREAASLDKATVTVSQANIEGNVQSSAIQLFDDNVTYSSSGATVRAETRESVLKDFSEILKGSNGGCRLERSDNSFSGTVSKCKLGNEELYLIDFSTGSGDKQSVRTSTLGGWGVERVADDFVGKTLVVIGSSIIVDDNMYFTGNDKSSYRYKENAAYGLVALKDSSGRGGNIYITSGVTDIRGHIYTDGSIYGVEMAELVGDKGGSVNGALLNIRENRENLFNQLTIVGQVISQNTVGGGTASTPRAGNGSLLDDYEREFAKLTDINFWRISPMRLDLQNDGLVHLCGQHEAGVNRALRDQMISAAFEYPDGVNLEEGTLSMQALNYILDAAEYASTNIELEDFLCWDDSRGRTSVYFDPLRGVAEVQPLYERYVLNILFKVAPKGLPLF